MKKMRGITLIALIITIIVMLILVGVTVTTAINGGLFKQAQKAKTRHEEEYIKEQIQIALVSSIDERLIKYDKAYLEKLGIDTKAYDEFEQMGYHVGAGGNVNLLVLKGELEKILFNMNSDRFTIMKEKMSNRFEPAIENHLLEIVEINVSKEELDKYIKAKEEKNNS